MVARVCGVPGCPELKPCELHPVKVAGWQQRPSKRNQTRPDDASDRRRLVRERDEGVCYWCGSPGAWHVDHVQAIADGGSWDLENLAVMHEACHEAKTLAEREARR